MSLQKLHPRLQDFVKDNWPGLTPIQQAAFDPIFQGESCTIEAPTAGGKTEAVLFPLLTRISANKTKGFKVLYIAPLKALLNDLALRVEKYARICYMEAFKWHGDVSQGDKVQQFIFPSDILLTTPESLEAMLLRKPGWVEVFQNLETVVVDEAHYFALTERGSHLVALLERIADGIGKSPQRIAVTATVGNPEELLHWLLGGVGGRSIKEPMKGEKERDFLIRFFPEEGEQLKGELYKLLLQKKSIVFERSRSGTEATATWINQMNEIVNPPVPVKVKTHHSSVSKRLREDAEKSIKTKSEGSVNAIISTSTLELGIDIGDLDRVIQIGGLNSSGSFLQRVGRTGRRGGRPQYFRGLCTDPDEMLLLTACVSLGLRRVSEKVLFPRKAFHILAHQVICMCLQKAGATANEIWRILSKVSCFSRVTRAEFDDLVAYMLHEDFLREGGEGLLLTSNKTESVFLRANWKRLFAIFDTGPMYNVVDGKKIVGTLDSEFARAQELPFVFVLGGIEWSAEKISHEMQQISVVRNKTGLAPKWKAIADFDIPVELAQEIGRLLMSDEELSYLDVEATRQLAAQREIYRKLYWKTDSFVIDAGEEGGSIYIWTFAGEKINRALAALMGPGLPKVPTYDYRHLVVQSTSDVVVTVEMVTDLLESIRSLSAEEINDAITEHVKPKWFSKFSDCLPDTLVQATLADKGYDIEGLERMLQSVVVITDGSK